jgi:hypothetical protein
MKTPDWFDLFADLDTFPSVFCPVATLSPRQVEQLQAIHNAADCYGRTLGLGIAAIGELLAHAAETGEVSDRTATNLGWLLGELGALTAHLADLSGIARDKLTALNREG